MNDRCVTCGSLVRVKSSGEGTSYYVPIGEQENRKLIEKAYRQGWRDNDELNNPEVGAPFGLPQSEDEGVERFLDEIDGKN